MKENEKTEKIDIDDLVAEQEKQQTKLENALAEATFNSEIIGAISKLYWLIYRIDLVEKTYEEISAAKETHKLTGKKGYIADILEEMCDKKSKEFLAHAFEPFAQEDTSARTAYMGTGLGLPIAKQLAAERCQKIEDKAKRQN